MFFLFVNLMRHLQSDEVTFGISVRSATCLYFIVNDLIDDQPVSNVMQSVSR